MNPIKILFPTDFSNRSLQALGQAIKFCESTDSELFIYHVYHRPYSKTGALSDMNAKIDQLEQNIEKNFGQLKKTYPGLQMIKYTFKKELGVSIEKIAETANKEQVDLIISATKGAKGFGELWGTKTEKIIREVNIPVIIIPDNSNIEKIQKIALACDYSEQTKYASLEMMVDMAEYFNWDVDVVSFNQDIISQTDNESQISEELLNRELVKKLLENVNTSFNFTFKDDVERGIIEHSRDNEIDLIAIVPKQYSYIQKLFHQSLTQKMIFHSPFPLLVLK